MLDVHVPEHRISHTRDFFIHLFTITIGLLIALGLENAAEAVHHRHIRQEAEDNIRHEIEGNRDLLQKSAPSVRAERDALVKIISGLEKVSTSNEVPALKAFQVSFQEAPIADSAWTTAGSTGALSYMSYGEVQKFADAYKQQNLLQNVEEQALNDYLEFSPILQMHSTDLTAAMATEALPITRRALAHVNGMLAVGQGTLESYNNALQ